MKIDFKKTYDKIPRITKRTIADKVRVSWQEVQNWYKDVRCPSRRNNDDLIAFFKENNIDVEYINE